LIGPIEGITFIFIGKIFKYGPVWFRWATLLLLCYLRRGASIICNLFCINFISQNIHVHITNVDIEFKCPSIAWCENTYSFHIRIDDIFMYKGYFKIILIFFFAVFFFYWRFLIKVIHPSGVRNWKCSFPLSIYMLIKIHRLTVDKDMYSGG
jgi:hypothetical protein